jgi:hypothetical protein
MIRTFRQKRGDLGFSDRAALPDVEDAVAATKAHLESYLPEERKLGRRMPLRAQLVSQDDQVIADFRLTPKGAERIDGGKDT